MSIVSIENLNYFYGKKQILKELKLDIDENKLTGIIGPNGCGKSTLAKNIIKYLNGDFKKLEIMEIDIKKLSHKKVGQLSTQKNISVIIIIHDLNLASLFCDNLIVLKDGKFIKKGSPYEVINEQNIKDVYNLDCKVLYNEDNKPYIIPKT